MAYGKCVATHIDDIQKDICTKEFLAFKECVQKHVLKHGNVTNTFRRRNDGDLFLPVSPSQSWSNGYLAVPHPNTIEEPAPILGTTANTFDNIVDELHDFPYNG